MQERDVLRVLRPDPRPLQVALRERACELRVACRLLAEAVLVGAPGAEHAADVVRPRLAARTRVGVPPLRGVLLDQVGLRTASRRQHAVRADRQHLDRKPGAREGRERVGEPVVGGDEDGRAAECLHAVAGIAPEVRDGTACMATVRRGRSGSRSSSARRPCRSRGWPPARRPPRRSAGRASAGRRSAAVARSRAPVEHRVPAVPHDELHLAELERAVARLPPLHGQHGVQRAVRASRA